MAGLVLSIWVMLTGTTPHVLAAAVSMFTPVACAYIGFDVKGVVTSSVPRMSARIFSVFHR
jgi:hypothetical protein